ncbi:MAG: hypothetical protein MUE98_01030 [Rhodobacteraceae bacterium]|jgi:hypothetical protein|nr:hypothetical protein [Paracoccaceae bacterium]
MTEALSPVSARFGDPSGLADATRGPDALAQAAFADASRAAEYDDAREDDLYRPGFQGYAVVEIPVRAAGSLGIWRAAVPLYRGEGGRLSIRAGGRTRELAATTLAGARLEVGRMVAGGLDLPAHQMSILPTHRLTIVGNGGAQAWLPVAHQTAEDAGAYYTALVQAHLAAVAQGDYSVGLPTFRDAGTLVPADATPEFAAAFREIQAGERIATVTVALPSLVLDLADATNANPSAVSHVLRGTRPGQGGARWRRVGPVPAASGAAQTQPVLKVDLRLGRDGVATVVSGSDGAGSAAIPPHGTPVELVRTAEGARARHRARQREFIEATAERYGISDFLVEDVLLRFDAGEIGRDEAIAEMIDNAGFWQQQEVRPRTERPAAEVALASDIAGALGLGDDAVPALGRFLSFEVGLDGTVDALVKAALARDPATPEAAATAVGTVAEAVEAPDDLRQTADENVRLGRQTPGEAAAALVAATLERRTQARADALTTRAQARAAVTTVEEGVAYLTRLAADLGLPPDWSFLPIYQYQSGDIPLEAAEFELERAARQL